MCFGDMSPERHFEDATQLTGVGIWQLGTASAVLDGVQESMRTQARAVSICLGFAERVIHGKHLQDSMLKELAGWRLYKRGFSSFLFKRGKGILTVLSRAELVI